MGNHYLYSDSGVGMWERAAPEARRPEDTQGDRGRQTADTSPGGWTYAGWEWRGAPSRGCGKLQMKLLEAPAWGFVRLPVDRQPQTSRCTPPMTALVKKGPKFSLPLWTLIQRQG